MMNIKWETTRCAEGGCVEIGAIGPAPDGTDWFRVRSTLNPHQMVAITGAELRAFLRQVRAGQFDTIARLEPDTTMYELLAENAELRGLIEDYERIGRVAS